MASMPNATFHCDTVDAPHTQQTEMTVVAMPQLATYVQPAREQRVQPVKLLQYHILRITMALLSGTISALTLVSVIANIVACHKIYSYTNDSDTLHQAQQLTVCATVLSVYCLVTTLVCFVLAVKSLHTFVAGRCTSICLAIAVALAILCTVPECIFDLTGDLTFPTALGALPMIRLVLMSVYFVLIIVCACTVDKDAQYDDQQEPLVITYLGA